jgi:hypothetical protein
MVLPGPFYLNNVLVTPDMLHPALKQGRLVSPGSSRGIIIEVIISK